MAPSARPTLGLLVAGRKGLHALADLVPHLDVRYVATYDTDEHGAAVSDFEATARATGAEFHVSRRPPLATARDLDLVAVIGWQFLIPEAPSNMVVLHDSLLPRYRGFAPTVAALINGDRQIGVTVLVPSDEVDAGPILAQRSVDIRPPVRIADAFDLLRPCYRDLVIEVAGTRASTGSLAGTPQDHSDASYSQWRDQYDYLIDWSLDAAQLQRHVYAHGAPYPGALAVTDAGQVLVVTEATPTTDRRFEGRVAGKVHRVGDSELDVVCGEGILTIGTPLDRTSRRPVDLPLRTRFLDISAARVVLAGLPSA